MSEQPRPGSGEWWKRELKRYCLTLLMAVPFAVLIEVLFDPTGSQVRRAGIWLGLGVLLLLGLIEIARALRRRRSKGPAE